MKAAFWNKRMDISVNETEEPVPGPDQVKVQVKWCGLCGSDIHEYLGGPIAIPEDEPHPLTGKKAPVILGHEVSGDVIEVGKDVTNLSVGDRVVVEPLVMCGECPACREDKYNLCEKLGFLGLCGIGGGFAEYLTYPARYVHKMPDHMTYEQGALVEPVAVAVHSLKVGGFKIGQNALVIGAGPIGLLTVTTLKAAGAAQVFVVQRKSDRQRLAKIAGADAVFDPAECDAAEEIKRRTGGGVDIAFEVTGSKSGFDIGMKSLRYAGTFVITSIWEEEISVNLNDIVYPEINIVGTISSVKNFPMTIKLIADGRINADYVVTSKIHLDEIVEKGIDVLTGPEKKKHAKILVTPDERLL
ncbi:MAG: 2,3-butanediol dehydrogenase [Clostridiales Family XIII bacterium]|jgi:(R,R)-butanediol dehydrogenase/meso-butanediol dehydrogenase/diacetyl reductase|nr:2,3-butanediol dehydrogenase [Clostridiales Family XIII bacterium]